MSLFSSNFGHNVALILCFGSVLDLYTAHTTKDTCNILREKFANATSKFIMCSIDKSKPITFCEDCVNEYFNILESYQNMSSVKLSDGISCLDLYVNLDRLEIVKTQFTNNTNLWAEAKCYECFKIENSTQTKNLSDKATKFHALYEQYNNCINLNEKNLTNLCDSCRDDYIHLDNFYRHISNENEKIGTCMDLVDRMNGSWTFWGKNCCRFRRHNESIFVTSTVLMLVITVLFYVWAQYSAKRKSATILHQTRYPVFLSSTSVNHL